MAFKSFLRQASTEESSAAEKLGEIERKIEEYAPALRSQFQDRYFLIGLGLAMGALGGLYYFTSKNQD